MRYRNYTALEISRYVLTYYKSKNKYISNLKLQPILYFIQAEFLAQFGYTAFNDTIVAKDWGVSIPNVYEHFRMNVGWPITSNLYTEFDPTTTRAEREALEDVLNITADYSFTELVDLIRSHDPWKDSYKDHCNNIIEVSHLKKFYSKEDETEDISFKLKTRWLLLAALVVGVLFLI